LLPGEKTQAVWDYSEHATITQGQLLEKSSKNAIFLKVMWKTPLFKRLFRPARARESGIVLFCAGRATPREIWYPERTGGCCSKGFRARPGSANMRASGETSSRAHNDRNPRFPWPTGLTHTTNVSEARKERKNLHVATG
jgi:hypothetical protein